MGNSTVGPNVTNWWEKQKEKLFPTNPWNRKPAWELTPTKNDILDFQRAQLSDKYGGDFSSWTPEGAFAYSYGQKTENKQNTDPGGGGGGSASSTANHYAALLAQVQAQQDAAARRAEELARQKVNENDIMNEARRRSAEIIRTAEERAKELMGAANAYCEDLMKRTEEAVAHSLEEVKSSRAQFKQAAQAANQ